MHPSGIRYTASVGWLGKVIGGSIGFMVGGPIGAIMGAVLGHGLDTLGEVGGTAPRLPSRPDDTERSQYIFFVTTFSLLAKMAKADGVVTSDEIDTVERFIRDSLRLDRTGRELAIRIFSKAKTSSHSFESFAQQFQQTFAHNHALRFGMLEILYRVAMADGILHPAEDRLLQSAQQIFQIPAGEAQRLRNSYVPNTERYYAVLGCRPSDSMTTIKSAYRALTRENHPDVMVSKGLPEEFIELANRKLQEINEAYREIKRARAA